jgi:hypothetical protein
MTRDQNIETIRTACIKANPEKVTLVVSEENPDTTVFDGPIRLADVLLAIQATTTTKGTTLVNSYGIFMDTHFNMDMNAGWNLRQDDLTLQSDECVAFLASLLQ